MMNISRNVHPLTAMDTARMVHRTNNLRPLNLGGRTTHQQRTATDVKAQPGLKIASILLLGRISTWRTMTRPPQMPQLRKDRRDRLELIVVPGENEATRKRNLLNGKRMTRSVSRGDSQLLLLLMGMQ